MGQSVSFTSGTAVLASVEAADGADGANATKPADNSDCQPEQLDCLTATIGGEGVDEEGGNSTAGVETVAVWDEHVSGGWASVGRRLRAGSLPSSLLALLRQLALPAC